MGHGSCVGRHAWPSHALVHWGVRLFLHYDLEDAVLFIHAHGAQSLCMLHVRGCSGMAAAAVAGAGVTPTPPPC